MREGSFEKINLERFLGSDKKVLKLINDPFYENDPNFFVKKEWISAEIANDFFIEKSNFSIFKELMILNGEKYFLLTYSSPFKQTPFYKISIDANIELIRKFMIDESHWTTNWYFISLSEKWAGISVYDGSALYIGYDKIFRIKMEEIFKDNVDFVRFF